MRLPSSRLLPPDSWLGYGYGYITRRLRFFRPDIIHVHAPDPTGWMGLVAGRRLGIPVISTYHANLWAAESLLPWYSDDVTSRVIDHFIRAFYGRCNLVIAPTRIMRLRLRIAGVRRPIVVISNGVDLVRFHPRESLDEPPHGPTVNVNNDGDDRAKDRPSNDGTADGFVTILYAGRLSKEKGIGDLMETIRFLCEGSVWDDIPGLGTKTKLCFRIVGDGPLRKKLEDFSRQTQSNHCKTVVAGHVPWMSMPDEYREADVFLFPSPSETQGLVVLEAMASGLPAVGVSSGGVNELVHHGKTGLLVRPGDAVGMARALLWLAGDSYLRRQLGRNGRQKVLAHDVLHTTKQLEKVYEFIREGNLGRNPGTPGREWLVNA